jgi:hypothetical protein
LALLALPLSLPRIPPPLLQGGSYSTQLTLPLAPLPIILVPYVKHRGTQICLTDSYYQISSFSSVVEREIADLQVARSNRAGSFLFAVRATEGVMGFLILPTQKLFIYIIYTAYT